MATAVPPLRTVDDLVLELIGDIAQNISAYRIMLAISVEETDHSRRLLERLNQPVQQEPAGAPGHFPDDATLLVIAAN